MKFIWGAAALVIALAAIVILVLLGRPLYLLAEIWWILFLAFLAGMVAAWYGHARQTDADHRRRSDE